MDGDYKHMIDEVFIIDSRYPYEYEGGHVKVQFCYMHVVVVSCVSRIYMVEGSQDIWRWEIAWENCQYLVRLKKNSEYIFYCHIS